MTTNSSTPEQVEQSVSPASTKRSSIAFGVVVGLIFAASLRWIDDVWPPEHPGHVLLDWTIPVVLGVGLGLVLELARNRTEKYRAEQRALESLHERLRGSEREQAVWVLASSLLHELRNPLHTLGLALEELEHCEQPDRRRRLRKQARQAVERMNDRFKQLGAMVDQPAQLQVAYDLAKLVRQTTEHFDALARQRGARVRLRGSSRLEVVGDEVVARTALENLVSNAIDALGSRDAGMVNLLLEPHGNVARLTVCDNGQGVDAAMQHEIFKPLRTTKGPHHGLGLGLPIARGLARAAGGDVTFEAQDPGACFVLTLPLNGNE